MPGFDRTGPQGEGPLTGGGWGQCGSGKGVSVSARRRGVGQGGMPRGGGMGRCWGGGRGRFMAGRFSGNSIIEQENNELHDYIGKLEGELEEIKQQLKSMNSNDAETD